MTDCTCECFGVLFFPNPNPHLSTASTCPMHSAKAVAERKATADRTARSANHVPIRRPETAP